MTLQEKKKAIDYVIKQIETQPWHLVSESPPYIQGQFFVPKDTAPQSTMLS